MRQPDVDPLRYYDLERYLFEDVHRRFHAEGSIGAFDLFSIVIWKANRSKSVTAARLLSKDPGHRLELEPICRDMTGKVYAATDDRARMGALLDPWKFRLPMASAILTVFWPDRFSVFDYRACEELLVSRKTYDQLASEHRAERIWPEYEKYLSKVHSIKTASTLRDKDRWLWGKSASEQLRRDLARGFGVQRPPMSDAPPKSVHPRWTDPVDLRPVAAASSAEPIDEQAYEAGSQAQRRGEARDFARPADWLKGYDDAIHLRSIPRSE